MLKKLLSRKFVLVLLVLIIIPGVIIIYQFLAKPEEVEKKQGIIPSEITPTPLYLVSIHPQSGDVQLADTHNSITVTFNKTVDINSVVTETTPNMEFSVKSHPDPDFPYSIILIPQSPWRENENYKITIKEGVRSLNRSSIYEKDIEIEYRVLPTEYPNYDRPA